MELTDEMKSLRTLLNEYADAANTVSLADYIDSSARRDREILAARGRQDRVVRELERRIGGADS